jgi:hypothetical protein
MDSECPCSVRSQTSETFTSHSACRAMYSGFFTFCDSVQYWRSLRRPCLTPSAHVQTFIYMWKGFVLVFTKKKYSYSRRERNWYLGNRLRLEGSFTTPPLYPTTHWIDGGMRPRAGLDALGKRKTVCVWRNRITIARLPARSSALYESAVPAASGVYETRARVLVVCGMDFESACPLWALPEATFSWHRKQRVFVTQLFTLRVLK